MQCTCYDRSLTFGWITFFIRNSKSVNLELVVEVQDKFAHRVRSEAFDIHFLSLGLKGSLMGDNSLKDLRVEEDDNDHWQGIVHDEGIQDVALVIPILC